MFCQLVDRSDRKKAGSEDPDFSCALPFSESEINWLARQSEGYERPGNESMMPTKYRPIPFQRGRAVCGAFRRAGPLNLTTITRAPMPSATTPTTVRPALRRVVPTD